MRKPKHIVKLGKLSTKEKAEREATLIAYDLLMPEERVRELVDQKYTIEQMARKFTVSDVVMTMRVLELYPNFVQL